MSVPLTVLAVAVFMFIIERFYPARRHDHNTGWWMRAACLNGLQAGVAYLGAVTWDRYMVALFPDWLSDQPIWLQIGGGYLVVTFIYYWWHRARHSVPVLWRYFHRVHHSPSRLEVITSFYKHPAELVVNGLLSSFILTGLLGFAPEVASAVVLVTGLAELIYHWNVRTPYWLGWFFQRPEMHRVHHERGQHRSNYSDLPIWDLLFCTYDNPGKDDCICGFPAEDRLGRLLLGKSVRES